MAENTQAPAAETKPEAAKEPEVLKVSLTVGKLPIVHAIFGRKVRGKEEEKEVCIPELAVDNLQAVLAYAEMIGVPNFVGTLVREVFRPAAYEASDDGFKDGKFNGVKYLESFKAYFDPRQAKSRGPKKAEILQAQAKYTEELTELIVKATSGTWGEADKNRFMVIKVELAKLSELAAKKDRRGKAPATTPAEKK